MRAILAILPFALLVTACSAQGTVEVEVTSTSQASTAPPPQDPAPEILPQLNATITRVDVHVDAVDTPFAEEPNQEDSVGWTTIFEGEKRINLLDSSAVARTLGSAPAPTGTVSQVRLVLQNDVMYVDAMGEQSVKCPSCSQSGLKLNPQSNVEIEEDGVLRLTLDFDADTSLVENAQGLILKPVIKVQAVNE